MSRRNNNPQISIKLQYSYDRREFNNEQLIRNKNVESIKYNLNLLADTITRLSNF